MIRKPIRMSLAAAAVTALFAGCGSEPVKSTPDTAAVTANVKADVTFKDVCRDYTSLYQQWSMTILRQGEFRAALLSLDTQLNGVPSTSERSSHALVRSGIQRLLVTLSNDLGDAPITDAANALTNYCDMIG